MDFEMNPKNWSVSVGKVRRHINHQAVTRTPYMRLSMEVLKRVVQQTLYSMVVPLQFYDSWQKRECPQDIPNNKDFELETIPNKAKNQKKKPIEAHAHASIALEDFHFFFLYVSSGVQDLCSLHAMLHSPLSRTLLTPISAMSNWCSVMEWSIQICNMHTRTTTSLSTGLLTLKKSSTFQLICQKMVSKSMLRPFMMLSVLEWINPKYETNQSSMFPIHLSFVYLFFLESWKHPLLENSHFIACLVLLFSNPLDIKYDVQFVNSKSPMNICTTDLRYLKIYLWHQTCNLLPCILKQLGCYLTSFEKIPGRIGYCMQSFANEASKTLHCAVPY